MTAAVGMRQKAFRTVFFREQWFTLAIYLAGTTVILAGLDSMLGDPLRWVIFTAWLYVALEYIHRPFKRRGILRVRRQARSRRGTESEGMKPR